MVVLDTWKKCGFSPFLEILMTMECKLAFESAKQPEVLTFHNLK